jgi:hypothetical protein
MSGEHSHHLATASLMVVAQEKAQIWQHAEDVASQGWKSRDKCLRIQKGHCNHLPREVGKKALENPRPGAAWVP